MTRIFDPGGGETERSGSTFGSAAAGDRSKMPPDAVDGEIERGEGQLTADTDAADANTNHVAATDEEAVERLKQMQNLPETDEPQGQIDINSRRRRLDAAPPSTDPRKRLAFAVRTWHGGPPMSRILHRHWPCGAARVLPKTARVMGGPLMPRDLSNTCKIRSWLSRAASLLPPALAHPSPRRAFPHRLSRGGRKVALAAPVASPWDERPEPAIELSGVGVVRGDTWIRAASTGRCRPGRAWRCLTQRQRQEHADAHPGLATSGRRRGTCRSSSRMGDEPAVARRSIRLVQPAGPYDADPQLMTASEVASPASSARSSSTRPPTRCATPPPACCRSGCRTSPTTRTHAQQRRARAVAHRPAGGAAVAAAARRAERLALTCSPASRSWASCSDCSTAAHGPGRRRAAAARGRAHHAPRRGTAAGHVRGAAAVRRPGRRPRRAPADVIQRTCCPPGLRLPSRSAVATAGTTSRCIRGRGTDCWRGRKRSWRRRRAARRTFNIRRPASNVQVGRADSGPRISDVGRWMLVVGRRTFAPHPRASPCGPRPADIKGQGATRHARGQLGNAAEQDGQRVVGTRRA